MLDIFIQINQQKLIKKYMMIFKIYKLLISYCCSSFNSLIRVPMQTTTTNLQSKIISPQEVDKKLQELLFKNVELTTPHIKGYDFNEGINYQNIFKNYASFGLQATHLAKAVDIINEMLNWRLSDEPLTENDDEETSDSTYRQNMKCKIFLGYTSNMISSGMRQLIRFLVEHSLVDCLVTTAGGIEEDLMKCMGKFHIADYNMNDVENRLNGHCRIGNILVPNENYVKLEDFLLPIFSKMAEEQDKKQINWTPSKVIHRLGKQINNPQSVYYWCYKNNIPVFCPALTDGGIGDVLFTNSFKNDLRIDVVEDMKQIGKISMRAKHKAGAVILGGSIPKHHILNSAIWRNGLDYAVLINTGLYEDGSDSGAKMSEAYTWAKLRLTAKSVKIWGQASLIFPILVGQTFARKYWKDKESKQAVVQKKK